MMNQEDIFKKIGLIINELQDQYEYLAQNPQQLNELELELFMANAHFLSDHVQIVQKLNSTKIQQQLPAGNAAKEEKPLSGAGNSGDTSTASAVTSDVVAGSAVIELPAASSDIEAVSKEEKAPVAEPVLFQEPSKAEQPLAEAEIPVVEDEPLATEEVAPEEEELASKKEKAFTEYQENEQKNQSSEEEEDVHTLFEKEVFKIDNESSSFEFILKDSNLSDKFDFEEKSIDDIFDRPLSKEEEFIIAQKQKLRAQQEQSKVESEEEDEIGPEPFLVAKEESVIPPATTQLVPDQLEQKEMPLEREIQHQSNEVPAGLSAGPEVPAAATPEGPVSSAVPPVSPPATPLNPSAHSEPVKTPEAEKKDESKLTLNERLAGQMGAKTTSAGGNRQSLTDLKQGININDKMLYVKDLFNGYGLAYSEVIDHLNKMPDFKTADAFLQNNYAVKNNWSAKQGTVDKFYELLNRRFPASEG